MTKFIWAATAISLSLLSGCERPADVASYNLSRDADHFRISRRIVFINGITDKYLLSIEGRCSLGNTDKTREISVTCKVAEGAYKKHFLGLSDNVTYLVEQLDPVAVDTYHYKVVFRPQTIVPSIDLDVR